MAKSKFINYFAYKGVNKSVKDCGISPNKGIIIFNDIHFTENAKINLVLYFDNQKTITKIKFLKYITKDENNVYTFSANDLLSESGLTNYKSFQSFSIEISENNTAASIVFKDPNNILEQALSQYDNIFFRFSYDVTDANCKQFNNCILYIEQDDSSNYTYMNWISPIASGNDIKSYITGTTSTESSSITNEDGSYIFEGSLEKCIKADSSTTWISAFKDYVAENGPATIPKYEYHGKIKWFPSKKYEDGNLVRFQDIDLTSINSDPPKIDIM